MATEKGKEFLALPYFIWSSFSTNGIWWEKTLETHKEGKEGDFTFKVSINNLKTPRSAVIRVQHDGNQFQIIETKGRIPKYLIRDLECKYANEVDFAEKMAEIISTMK